MQQATSVNVRMRENHLRERMAPAGDLRARSRRKSLSLLCLRGKESNYWVPVVAKS